MDTPQKLPDNEIIDIGYDLASKLGFENPKNPEHMKELFRENPFKLTENDDLNKSWLSYFWMVAYNPTGQLTKERTKQEIFNTYFKAMHDVFNYVSCSGYNVRSNQSIVHVCLSKSHDLNKQLEEFNYFAKYIKTEIIEANKEQKFKYVSVMDHNLSENGAYQIHLGENYCTLNVWRYHRFSKIEVFNKLFDCFKYMVENDLWYEE